MRDIPQNFQMDAVIPWVNGNDIVWQKKLNEHSTIKIDFNKEKESERFNSIGEIDMAIKSIIKYAPFLKNIYLVTDDQTPNSFEDLKKLAHYKGINLKIIDHKIVFRGYEQYLPCFNSCSIGSMLYRIPNLSDHFIIFNDDVFLMRETKPSDFFINGVPIIRGQWKEYYENQSIRNLYYKSLSLLKKHKNKKTGGFKTFQQNSAKLVGVDRYLRRFHTPVSVRKSTLEKFFKGNDLLKNNIKHRFRQEEQFIISSLSEHLEIKNNTYHYKKNTQLTYFRTYKSHLIVKLKLLWFSINKSKLFITCQSLEMANDKTQSYILDWINKRLD
jgi:hypothetical protein